MDEQDFLEQVADTYKTDGSVISKWSIDSYIRIYSRYVKKCFKNVSTLARMLFLSMLYLKNWMLQKNTIIYFEVMCWNMCYLRSKFWKCAARHCILEE
ncbi:MAG: hypothetical protein K2N87_19760 [Eubacterium sp.]|nr:hypothetical protein [Eubacterium sp.]